MAEVVESPARRNRDKERPRHGRDEANGAPRELKRLDERPPDASKNRIDEHIDGTGEVPKMQGAASAFRHGRQVFFRPVVRDKIVIVLRA